MDLIILCSSGYRHRDLGLRSCLRGIEKNLPHDRLFLAGCKVPEWCSEKVLSTYPALSPEMGDIEHLVELFTTYSDLSDQVIVMDDHTFLRTPFVDEDVCIVNASVLKRSGEHVDRMVDTINYLLNDERESMDYETGLPVVIDKALLMKLAARVPSKDLFLRTTYLNIFKQPHVLQVKGTVLDQWSQDLNPSAPWLNLSELALEHPQCQKWLRRNFDEKSSFEK